MYHNRSRYFHFRLQAINFVWFFFFFFLFHLYYLNRRSCHMDSRTQIVVVTIVVQLVLVIQQIDYMNMIHWHCIRLCKVLSMTVKIPAWMKIPALCQTYLFRDLFWKVSKSCIQLKFYSFFLLHKTIIFSAPMMANDGWCRIIVSITKIK